MKKKKLNQPVRIIILYFIPRLHYYIPPFNDRVKTFHYESNVWRTFSKICFNVIIKLEFTHRRTDHHHHHNNTISRTLRRNSTRTDTEN